MKKKRDPRTRAEAARGFSPFSDPARDLPRAAAEAAVAQTSLYFAFGSNMNREQMSRRCPRAEFLGPVSLPGWKLVARGVADVDRVEGGTVHGALWRLTADCVENLDRYEGFPSFYGREVVRVSDHEGGGYWAWVYVMAEGHKRHESPFSFSYASACALGARQCGVPVDPLFVRDIQSGPMERAPRPWTTVQVPDDAAASASAPKREPLPDHARESVADWCRAKGISPTKVANILAFASYDAEREEVRVSGGGSYVTIPAPDRRGKKKAKPVAKKPAARVTLSDLDEIDRDAERQLASDENLLEIADAYARFWGREDRRVLERARRCVEEGRLIDPRDREVLRARTD